MYPMTNSKTAAIILAAGQGTRMLSDMPKVLHKVGGLSMIGHVLSATAGIEKIVAIVGHGRESVQAEMNQHRADVQIAEQTQQLGTGHAVKQARQAFNGFGDGWGDGFPGDVFILNGDVPLVSAQLLDMLYQQHQTQQNTLTVLTTTVPDPTGLGRILRDENGHFQAIVEHNDASQEQRNIEEINTGIYLVKAHVLFELLEKVTNQNAKGEFYLTDIVGLARERGAQVGACQTDEGLALLGVNTPSQLADAEHIFQAWQRQKKLRDGVYLKDSSSTYFNHDTTISKGTIVGPNVQFLANVDVGENCFLEGNAVLKDTTLEPNTHILSFCHLEGACVAQGATVGPFARLRNGSHLGENSKIGNFCEVKNTELGAGSKASHLTYLGDAHIGTNVNIGAGTITCNYDGTNKHKTIIENGAFIGSNTSLVAPVKIGEGALIGAGATIRKDVTPAHLAFTTSAQKQTSKKKV